MASLSPLKACDVPKDLVGWSVLLVSITAGFQLSCSSVRFTSNPRKQEGWKEALADSTTMILCESEHSDAPFALFTRMLTERAEEELGRRAYFLRYSLRSMGLTDDCANASARSFSDTLPNLRALKQLVENNQVSKFCKLAGIDPVKEGARSRAHGRLLDRLIVPEELLDPPEEN